MHASTRRGALSTILVPLAALAIAIALLIGCERGNDTPGAPSETAPTQTGPVVPVDPYDKDVSGQWQRDTVAQIITGGKRRVDVGDNAILAALVASNAEAHWFLAPIGEGRRNLFGWSIVSTDRDPGNPTNDMFAIDSFYDRAVVLEKSADGPLGAVELAQRVQLDDDTKIMSYFEDRPISGDRRSSLSTPRKSLDAYEAALPFAVAAYQLYGP